VQRQWCDQQLLAIPCNQLLSKNSHFHPIINRKRQIEDNAQHERYCMRLNVDDCHIWNLLNILNSLFFDLNWEHHIFPEAPTTLFLTINSRLLSNVIHFYFITLFSIKKQYWKFINASVLFLCIKVTRFQHLRCLHHQYLLSVNFLSVKMFRNTGYASPVVKAHIRLDTSTSDLSEFFLCYKSYNTLFRYTTAED